MEPAASIIRALGGPTAVSKIAGCHRTRVSNWQRSKEQGGTGGIIPQRYFTALLEAAKVQNIALSAEDFLPPKEAA